MGRYGTAEQIKERVTILQVLERYGYEKNRAGFIHCPFHQEKTPSLKIYPESNSYYCFGCGTGGDVIHFIMHLFHLDFRAAVTRICWDFRIQPMNQEPSRQQVDRWREEQRKKERELMEYRKEYVRRSLLFRELHFLEKPPEGLEPENPLWGTYAALLGQKEELEAWFEQNRWR